MITKSTTALLTLVLVAIITATMISAPQMIMTAFAQSTPPTQKACPPGYDFHPGVGGAPGKCTTDVKCPTGSTPSGTNCVSETPACPTGSTLQSDGRCATSTPACPTGSSLQADGTCLSSTPACPPHSTVQSDGTCLSDTTACPTGSTLQSDGRCATSTPACPTGSSLQADGTCLSSTPACPTGSTLQADGKCKSAPSCDAPFGPQTNDHFGNPPGPGPNYGTTADGKCTATGDPNVIKAGICTGLGGTITPANRGLGDPDKVCTYPAIPGTESANQCPTGFTASGTGQGICTAPNQCPTGFTAIGTGQGHCVAPNQCPTGFTASGTGQGICTAPNQCPTGFTASGTGQGICTAPNQCPTGFTAVGTGQGHCVAPNQCVSPFTATGTGTQGQCVAPIAVVGTCPPAPNGFTIVTVNGKLLCSTKPGQGPGTST